METTRLADGCGICVYWTVPGLVAEGRRVAAALAVEKPDSVAVGVSAEELEGLRHFLTEPVEDEGWTGEPYAIALSRYGAVGFPPPAYMEVVRFAIEAGVPISSLDLSSDAYDDRFTKTVSTWQWWRYGRRLHKLEKRPPRASTPEAFASAWDARLRASGRAVRGVETAREEAVLEALRGLAKDARVAAVLDVTLKAGVLRTAGVA